MSNDIKLGGRPLKFDTPEELLCVLEEYFNKTPIDEWTVTGLALNVGSKQLLDDYQKREGYKNIVEEAKLIVENKYEIDLKKHGRAGTMFALKNFGWTDRQEIKHEVTQGFINLDPLADDPSDNSTQENSGS
jgi:hypothetical protein